MKTFAVVLGAILVCAIFFSVRMSTPTEYLPLAAVLRDYYVPLRSLKDQHIDAKAHGSGGTLGISVPAGQTDQARAILEQTWNRSHFFMSLSAGDGLWKHYDESRVDAKEYKDPLWDAFTKAANEATAQHYSMGQSVPKSPGQ